MARTPKPIGLATVTPSTLTQSPVAPQSTGFSPPAVQSRPVNAIVLTMDETSKAGETAQTGIADATKKITAIAKTSDMDEIGKLLNATLAAAKGYNPGGDHGKGILGFVLRKREELRAAYDKVDKRVNDLVTQLDQRIALFDQRVIDLGQISVQNQTYSKSLTAEIQHMQDGVAYMEANPPVVIDGDMESARKAQEWQSVIAWARKRADDLRRAQIVADQQDAQITLMAQNSRALSAKFKDLKKTTLPLLQQTFVLYIINVEQAKNVEFADSVDDLTNKTLIENARSLGQNTTAVHTSLNRSNFSVEAIEANKNAVINALDEIDRIRAETKTRLAAEMPRLEQSSRELAERLARRPANI